MLLSRDQLYERRDQTRGEEQRLRAQRDELLARAQRDDALTDPGIVEKANRLQAGIDRAHEHALEAGRALVSALAMGDPTAVLEHPDGSITGGPYTGPAAVGPLTDRERVEDTGVAPHVRAARDSGLRTIERYRNTGELAATAADSLDALVRRDALGLDAEYLAAAGAAEYNTAFGKLLQHGPTRAPATWTPAENAAVQKVEAVEAQRGMVAGTGSSGGFALPIGLDPTVLLSGPGAVADGVRQYATVRTIATHELRLVSSAGTAASYDAEASVVSDDTPAFAQPVVTPAMARYFIPFSYEVGDDWGSLQQELLTLTTDARSVLDAVQFLTGSGTDSPAGVLTGLAVGQRVQTAGVGAYAVGDPWLLKAGLRPRDVNTATFAAAPGIWDATYRFVGGNSTEPAQFDAGRGGPFLGRPKFEWSSMVTTTTTGSKVMLAGDFSQFVIADRIGMSAEIIPALFDQATGRPTGQRGWFARWRTGSKVAVPEAFRYMEVK